MFWFWRDRSETTSMPSETIRTELSVERVPTIGHGSLPKGHVALTFDDGPHHVHTDKILSILGDANWQATFFQVGIQTCKFPAIARQVARAEHTVGSHTFEHLHLPDVPLARAKQDIQKGIKYVTKASKTKTPFFRFPYGQSNDSLDAYVAEEGLISFHWDVEARDWEIKDESQLLDHIMTQVRLNHGGVILLHDIHAVTVAILPKLIMELKSLQYTSVQFVAARH